MIKKIDKKFSFLAAAVVLVAGGLVWSAFFWQFGKIRLISDDIQKQQLDSLVQQQRSQKILELGKELGDVESQKKEMEGMFVDKENAVPFLKLIDEVASQTNSVAKIGVYDLTKIKTASAAKPTVAESDASSAKDIQAEDKEQKSAQLKANVPDYSNQLGFSIELTGRYGSLVDFLTKLENLPYLVKVYSFQSATVVARSRTAQTAGNGVSASSAAPAQSVPPATGEENKNIKTTIIIGVYTNGAK